MAGNLTAATTLVLDANILPVISVLNNPVVVRNTISVVCVT